MQLGARLNIPNQIRYPARIRFCNRLIAILEIRISTPKQSQLHSFVQDRGNVLKQEIESLLPGQSTYDAQQKRVRRWIKAKPPLQGRLVRRTELELLRAEPSGDLRIRLGIPNKDIDPCEDP